MAEPHVGFMGSRQLIARGWTRAMLRDLLPLPEHIDGVGFVWHWETVDDAEETPEFAGRLAKAARNRKQVGTQKRPRGMSMNTWKRAKRKRNQSLSRLNNNPKHLLYVDSLVPLCGDMSGTKGGATHKGTRVYGNVCDECARIGQAAGIVEWRPFEAEGREQ